MANIQWILGVEPTKLPSAWRERIQKLFLEETGEAYADVSIASLPIPAWEGNLLLVRLAFQNNLISLSEERPALKQESFV